jgi:hypothetical protein
MSKGSKGRNERIRRLIYGDILKVLVHRYGPTLPDDDAGRDDLDLLLLPVSLDPKAPVERTRAVIEVRAPWLSETKEKIEGLMALPLWYRRPSAKEIGERLRLTNAERERLKVWQIAPVDRTKEELEEQRKAKNRARGRKRYKQSRGDYEAKSKSNLKPWEAEGVSRATWYRRRETSQYQTKVLIGEHLLVSPSPDFTTDGYQEGGSDGLHGQPDRQRQTNECLPPCSARGLVSQAYLETEGTRG